MSQLSLNFHLCDEATFANFFPGDNQELISALQAFSDREGQPFLYVWGRKGVGKSHLLQAICHRASEKNLPSLYLPLSKPDYSPEMLIGIEAIPLVCLDDVESISGNRDWEEAIFHLFNRIQAQQGSLIVSSELSPAQLTINLSDLKSRLSSGVSYQIHALEDQDKQRALQSRAKQRGLELTDPVSQFLLTHCPRDTVRLFEVLNVLDKASLQEQRRLTIPFIKQVLEI